MSMSTEPGRVILVAPGTYVLRCPGCDMYHQIWVAGAEGRTAHWSFNGDTMLPTFSPSLKVTWNLSKKPRVCHSFIRNGQIQYLDDCTHRLKGQTVDLPVIHPDWSFAR